MVKVSIVIVNYNVSHFLEQCLLSIRKSSFFKNSFETIVVDNASSDNSCNMVLSKFPEVQLVKNTINAGFSAGNNQGIKLAKGEYILLLNPDTVIAEDSLELCSQFLDKNSDCGSLGVRMLDGGGNFLPESKRGLPTPIVSFYKIFGLSKLFPKSKTFGQYHLKFLSEKETNPVDVLSGAFMFLRKNALEKAGLLDETFFMYGEDIDLSYRIQQVGYKNYYFPQTTIIHYKGESTRRNSLKYVKTFYQAMLIFAEKHFAVKFGKIFGILIHLAVYLRAFLSATRRFVKAISPAIVEWLLFYLIYFGVARYWEEYNKFVKGGAYPLEYFYGHLSSFALIIVIGLALAGAYSKYYSGTKFWRGIFLGIALLISAYALLPESLRYSRAVVMLGASLSAFAAILFRSILNYVKNKSFVLGSSGVKKILVIGNYNSFETVVNILNKEERIVVSGFLSENETNQASCLGNKKSLESVLQFYKIDEIVLCAETLGNKQIISFLDLQSFKGNTVYILPTGADFIIGSSSKNAKGYIYPRPVELKIVQTSSKINKRIFDIGMSLLLFPFLPFISKKINGNSLNTWADVIVGKKTWVGYDISKSTLPKIKPCVWILSEKTNAEINPEAAILFYAKHYSPQMDFDAVIRHVFTR